MRVFLRHFTGGGTMKDSREPTKPAAVCSFIGHRDIYDADIESRLQAAVDTLVKEYLSFLPVDGAESTDL